MRRLVDNPVRRYAWGSVDAIPRLLGTSPDGAPQAELWLGAHERGDSRVEDRAGVTGLLDLVARDPRGQLGEPWARQRRMPFLAKVVATAEPLSLQVHPDAAHAARWYAEEEARGIARDARERHCPDDVAKVEMTWALTHFRALCGFRPCPESVRWLEALEVPALRPTAQALRRRGRQALPQEVARLLRLPAPADAVAVVRSRAEVLEDHPRWRASARAARELATRHPEDPAVALALLLQPVELAPGEAMFVRAGQPHTYLSGTAFEVQANSDNVLRAGLTAKHVDVDLLLQALDTAPGGVVAVAGERHGDEELLAPDTDRFALAVLHRPAGREPLPAVPGPEVYFCVDGEFRLDTPGEDDLLLRRGQAAYLCADGPAPRVRGQGTLLRVTTGRSPAAGGGSAGGPYTPRTDNPHRRSTR